MNAVSSIRWVLLLALGPVAAVACSSLDAGGGAEPTTGDGGMALGGDAQGAEPTILPQSPVLFSEIMYHPVAEDAAEDNHEFIEIYNRSGASVALDGCQVRGKTIAFTFPTGAVIGPKQYLVLAKNTAALLAIGKYALKPAQIAGAYTGDLGNGGEELQLLDGSNRTMDAVAYRDSFPWPVAADAFGAGEDWLKPPYTPVASHQYMGCSLERQSFEIPSLEVANWDASDIDGATPGRPNSRAGDPPAIVEELVAAAEGGAPLVLAEHKVLVRARLSARGSVTNLQLKSFVDRLDVDNEGAAMENMTKGADAWEITLPARPANTIVRYQVWGDRGRGPEQISPRLSDPTQWHAYFVSPSIPTKARVYHLFIDTAKWQKLYTNIAPYGGLSPRRVLENDCTVNPSWNATVPATFVFDGKVYDVRARYAGSNYNRLRGLPLDNFPFPKPADPKPFRVLSFKISFPKYSGFEGRDAIELNKLDQACPGITEFVAGRLFRAEGIPASDPRWARVYINGGYYHYMMENEEKQEEYIKKSQPKGAPMGDLFKAVGILKGDDGPYARTDLGVIVDSTTCKIKAADRYLVNYERKTNDWKKGNEIQRLIEGLTAARTAGTVMLRQFLAQNFDVAEVLTYLALRNWSGPWDDAAHNFMLYFRADGKWTVLPLDHDRELGVGKKPKILPTESFFIGETGDRSNISYPPNGVNWLKDAFFKTFRSEYLQRLKELDANTLSPASVIGIMDEGAAQFSVEDFNASPATKTEEVDCTDPAMGFEDIRRWARARHDEVLRAVP